MKQKGNEFYIVSYIYNNNPREEEQEEDGCVWETT